MLIQNVAKRYSTACKVWFITKSHAADVVSLFPFFDLYHSNLELNIVLKGMEVKIIIFI